MLRKSDSLTERPYFPVLMTWRFVYNGAPGDGQPFNWRPGLAIQSDRAKATWRQGKDLSDAASNSDHTAGLHAPMATHHFNVPPE